MIKYINLNDKKMYHLDDICNKFDINYINACEYLSNKEVVILYHSINTNDIYVGENELLSLSLVFCNNHLKEFINTSIRNAFSECNYDRNNDCLNV